MPERKASSGELVITQVRSAIGSKPKHRANLRALGLHHIGSSRVVPDRPEIRGMLARVAHLVEVRPSDASPRRSEPPAKEQR